jgi:hypothetical protein
MFVSHGDVTINLSMVGLIILSESAMSISFYNDQTLEEDEEELSLLDRFYYSTSEEATNAYSKLLLLIKPLEL